MIARAFLIALAVAGCASGARVVIARVSARGVRTVAVRRDPRL